MRLAEYTDYTLRVLMYCAARPERLVTISELAEHHDLSRNHLTKIVTGARTELEAGFPCPQAVVPAMGAKLAQRKLPGDRRHRVSVVARVCHPLCRNIGSKVGQKRLHNLSQQRKRTSVSVTQ